MPDLYDSIRTNPTSGKLRNSCALNQYENSKDPDEPKDSKKAGDKKRGSNSDSSDGLLQHNKSSLRCGRAVKSLPLPEYYRGSLQLQAAFSDN